MLECGQPQTHKFNCLAEKHKGVVHHFDIKKTKKIVWD